MNLLLLVSLVTVAAAVADEDASAAFRGSVNSFSAKIYKEMAAASPGSFLVCPLSSELVLALVLNGARGRTAQQLANGISLPTDLATSNKMVSAIVRKIHGGDSYTLKSVNKIFVSDDITIKSEFAKTAQEIFESTVDTIDFKNAKAAVDKVNAWAAENTENRINNLLTANDVNENTRMILLNAVYFQATFANKFNEKSTTQQSFYGSPNQVSMMKQTDFFDYFDHPNAQFLKMSYLERSDIAMIVALPKDKDGLSKLEVQIEDTLSPKNFVYKKVRVLFPKFTMDHRINMKPLLEKMGIADLFKPTADLKNMSDTDLYVSEVVQKNYIEVNETGTIAASATAVISGLISSYDPEYEEPIDFVADHPFIYYIVSPAGIMFVGRYYGPE